MPFKFNPFTDNLDIVDTTSGTGVVTTLTSDDAVVVFPISGNINIAGNGTSTTTTGNATSGTITTLVKKLGMSWTSIATSQTLALNTGYFCSAGGTLLLQLPNTGIILPGDTMIVQLTGATAFQITQPASHSIRIGNQTTTIGVGGSITSTALGDTLMIVRTGAANRWSVINYIGNFTVV